MARVLANGCFDILHSGHFNLFMFCRDLAGPGGQVMVAIDTDDRIVKLKGDHLPIFDQNTRQYQIRILKYTYGPLVDHVSVFRTDEDLENIITFFRADYLVKGNEWEGKRIIGANLAEVVFYNAEKNLVNTKISSSKIIEQILKKHEKIVAGRGAEG